MKYLAKLDLPVPEEIAGELLSRLPFVSPDISEFDLSPARDAVTFSLRANSSVSPETIASQVAEIVGRMCAGYRPIERRVLARELRDDFPYREDPHQALLDRGQLFAFGEGRYSLGPMPVALIEIFESDLRALATRFSAAPHQFPSLIGADTLDRCRYFKNFPHSLTFVTRLREGWENIRDFAQLAAYDGKSLTCAAERLSEIECLLAPSVCFHYYASLQNRTVSEMTITAVGKCFRYESRNLSGLERLWDFTMREIVFVGSSASVLEKRKQAVAFSKELLASWGLAYEVVTSTDPFFVDGFAIQSGFQTAFELKFEIRAPLPYRKAPLGIGSFNYHQDYFGRCFAISDKVGQAVHTACVGFGLERLALAFLAQHGLDPKRWPDRFAAAMEARGGQ